MEHPFTWVSAIPGLNILPDQVATSLIVAAIIVIFTLLARRQLNAAADPAIPDSTLSLRNIAEILVEGLSGMTEGTIGHHWRKYINLYGSFFVFILFANLIGLVPGFAPPTANFNVSLALGLVSFIAYNFVAFKEQGLAYLKHFAGPLLILAPLMFPLEIISNCVRPLSLGLRLLGNMTGDHLAIEIFTGLTKVIIPVIFYLLGAFVCFLQAFVFTLLSMVYVSNVLGHGDHH
ncbi:MAG: F0F1 ATP synthase subunit A [Deltaproteobacteria bacterium]|nr:F0F1 ATP synthase subunit A [Deltaproteobacteria bacterium]